MADVRLIMGPPRAPPVDASRTQEIPAAVPNPYNLATPGILEHAPPEPRSLAGTGVKQGVLADIVLRLLYASGSSTGAEVADTLKLPWSNVTEAIFEFLVAEKLVDLRGGKGFGRVSVEFSLSEKGREHAREALNRSRYVGPAPVPLEQYHAQLYAQRDEAPTISRQALADGLSHLVVPEGLVEQLGPAVNSGRSMFLYGPPGNGKTALAEAVSQVLGGETYVPACLEVDGHVIRVFDPHVHHPVLLQGPAAPAFDRRWQLCRRPIVVVGGELTLDTLDLIYSDASRFYEAPFQIKANGGMLLIDDFGRQKVHPTDLLNRWIVPLEKRVDFLTLHTGKKFELPFEQLIVFSTNLEPKQLVDEAFLRRITYKIEVPNPTELQFREIFRRVCTTSGLTYSEQAVTHLIQSVYRARGLEWRACHPRDLVQLLRDDARYRGTAPSLTPASIDAVARVFLVGPS